jgi:membrane fusion protein (multidrug efflux system)
MPKKKTLTLQSKLQQNWKKLPRSKTYKKVSKQAKKAFSYLKNHQLQAVGLVFAIFLLSFIGSQILRRPEVELPVQEETALSVQAIRFAQSASSLKAVGNIENKTTQTLVAQSNGPVAQIYVSEGQNLAAGRVILQQQSTYAGGNSMTVQREMAEKSLELAEASLQNTVETVSISREQADLSLDNTEKLNEISEKSIDDSKKLLDNVELVIEKLESDIASEQAGNNDPDVIAGLRSQLIQMQGSYNQTASALRQLEYQIDEDEPIYRLAELGKDLAYKATEIQLKSAQLNKDIAQLSLKAARIGESSTRVNIPFAGTVERILVDKGQFVAAGTPVAVVTGQPELQIVISLAGSVAQNIDTQQEIIAKINGQTFNLPIAHLSRVAVSGQAYQLLARLPEGLDANIYENQTVEVKLPLYPSLLASGNNYLPLDAVFITNTKQYVFVEENGRAVQREIVAGEIVGNNIELVSGLTPGEVVILDRRVINGQRVESNIFPSDLTIVELG